MEIFGPKRLCPALIDNGLDGAGFEDRVPLIGSQSKALRHQRVVAGPTFDLQCRPEVTNRIEQTISVIFVAAILTLAATAANAQLYGSGSNPNSRSVSGYTNSHGTYVAPHMQTNSNSTQMDNYGTRGNVNPYTGAVGTRTPRY